MTIATPRTPKISTEDMQRNIFLQKGPSAKLRQIYWVIPDRFDTRQDKSSWLEMARQLRESGCSVTIVAARSDINAQDYDGLVHYIDAPQFPFVFRWAALFASWQFLRHRITREDIVIMNEDSLWLLPLLRLGEGPHVHLDIRTVPVKLPGFKRWLDRVLFWHVPIRMFADRAASYSFITEPLRQEVQRAFSRSFSPFCIWQSGVNATLFSPSPSPCRSTPADNTFRLFYHGGLLMTRGIDLVLHALATTKFPFPISLTIVGDGQDRRALEALSARLGLNNVVTFTGCSPYELVVEKLRLADCCICPLPDLPEWRVSSPLKVLEYLACEKPMILTPLPAHLDAVRDIPTVTWTADYSPSAIGEAIIRAQEQKVDGELLKAGRQYVIDNFEWRVHAAHLRQLLEDVMEH
ncbi:MAG: glycosyltransferase [Pseudomonadales bacterium]